ncbi:SCO family protein [Alteriqipengyuania sp. WL0013]|uniref:SCO family protein n=1 Tax=Alteriqipengyuania sp. WL0013 TaxID=3110773 RepID=UPI002CE85978|nr:SCO family protein [Alteriqipengyuania sp. WL0013]MEB3415923.1 SCO family protein [Alteriqipengyuania sp. WL0013]
MLSPTKTIAAACMLLLATACAEAPPPAEPPLASASIGGDFTLTGTDGADVSWTDFEGKYRLVYFGYAFCPDICPNDVANLARGYKALKESDPAAAQALVPIFISIDPERDTPDVVAEFASAFSPDIVGLTGTPEQVAATAKKFAVYYAKGEETPDGGYLMDHSRSAILFGPSGEPIAPISVDQGGKAVEAELKQWVS